MSTKANKWFIIGLLFFLPYMLLTLERMEVIKNFVNNDEQKILTINLLTIPGLIFLVIAVSALKKSKN
jgi:hypothetical protein